MRTCVLVHVRFARRETKNPKIFLLAFVSRFFFSALNLFMSMFPSADCKFKINFSTSEYFIVVRGRKQALIAFSADFITHKASHEQSLKAPKLLAIKSNQLFQFWKAEWTWLFQFGVMIQTYPLLVHVSVAFVSIACFWFAPTPKPGQSRSCNVGDRM